MSYKLDLQEIAIESIEREWPRREALSAEEYSYLKALDDVERSLARIRRGIGRSEKLKARHNAISARAAGLRKHIQQGAGRDEENTQRGYDVA